ncbi:E3 ubiquitin-protein ligase TRIM31-like isoform X1 [Ochotona princeps]|uniref:E3 ubiquitin-protein ligase TRIM31-like isoform X1 n=1 Tax=Ochotona princeps TaxID=9978 RepID=UPI0027152E8B|nr:E3 ubiquitin-protein ligase TRIM31-like isoform X1 [Ochotona princeps]
MDPSGICLEEAKLRCSKHGEKLHYYCKSNGELLCVICQDSKEHRFHNTSLIEEAAKHHQEQIQKHVEVLEQKEKVLVHTRTQGGEKIYNFMAQVESEKQRIHKEFKNFYQVMEKEESILLSSTEHLDKEITKQYEYYYDVTQEQLSSLQNLKDSLKAKQQMPPRQLLQDIKGTLQRTEEILIQFHSQSPIPQDLEKQLDELKSRHDTVIENLRKFEAFGSLPQDQLHADRKKHQGKILQDKSTTHRQSRDPTAEKGYSTLHPTAQFTPRREGVRSQKTDSGLELPLSGALKNSAGAKTGGKQSSSDPETEDEESSSESETEDEESSNESETEDEKSYSDPETGDGASSSGTTTWNQGSSSAQDSSMELQQVLTPVIFDAASAHPALSLSQDLKTVKAEKIHQNSSDDPVEPQRFYPFYCVLGSPGFSTGRHSWEVELIRSRGQTCYVGVTWEQAPRRGKLTLEPANGFWVLCITKSKCQALTDGNTWKDLQFCPRRVCVYVDLEGKEVSFYDAATNKRIYTFQASFPGKIFPFFRLLFSGIQITLNP